jgi:nicotinate phosphoribosyltransferase
VLTAAGDPGASALLTDLYQLTMLQSYWRRGMDAPAVFELFVRRLPPRRGFLVAAGLAQAVAFLEQLRFTDDELAWVRTCGHFAPAFADWLAGLRFDGDVDAMPEGTVFFADEPVLRVTAPLPVAQLVETRLVNLLHFQTLIASKAARCVLVAPGRRLVDFGLRRAHGAEAGLLAARACWLAGFDGTSTALAEARFGIPAFGTMAHSYVLAHDDEARAFEDFAHDVPASVVLLIDTWDTERAAAKVVEVARRLRADGVVVQAVRIDSGDLAAHARAVRAILDAGGLADVRIFASGDLDEWRVRDLVVAGAPIDAFGIGTRLDTAADRPYLDCAYKLVAYAGRGRRKRSEGKATWPGAKQVWRRLDADGRLAGDVLALAGDPHDGEPLLVPDLRGGRRAGAGPTLTDARARAARELARLPEPLRRLDEPAPYAVEIAPALRRLAEEVDART